MNYPFLFSPVAINGMEVKNRIVMTAMHLGYTPAGEVTDQLLEFYRLRAKGGVGIIIVGGCPIDEYGGMQGMLRLDDDRFIEGLKRLTEVVKEFGAKVIAQLYQAGRYTHSSMIGGRKPFSASAVRSKLTGETPRALELDEIPQVQNRFSQAALRAVEAGFNGVEILGSAGYLISQFFSTLTNKREDEYGGSLDNRMRFGLEVVRKVREAVGPHYPVFMRIAGNDFMEGGNTNTEARQFASEAEKAGIDLFNVTGGWHETRVPQLTMSVPRQAYVYLARGIKSAVSVPVLASNRINDPEIGEEILRNGNADLVTMARALITDPYLPEKALNNKQDLIYHCIACNQGCFDNIFRFKPATCLVNPMAGREKELEMTPAEKAKKVLVIGGGPAGMKAACTAAERGHRVMLAEKESELGGQLILNRFIPGREEFLTAAKDLSNNMEAAGVEVRVETEADDSLVREYAPDAVVVATGAEPVPLEIPGVDQSGVVSAWEVLKGKAALGQRVVIVGGNAVGLETALYLASQGTLSPDALYFLMVNRAETPETLETLLNTGNRAVAVVEMGKKTGQDIGASTRWTVKAELQRLGVKVLSNTRATGISQEGLEVETPEGKDVLPADSIVIAAGSRSINGLVSKIQDLIPETYTIGDAKEPRNALSAIEEGLRIGLKI